MQAIKFDTLEHKLCTLRHTLVLLYKRHLQKSKWISCNPTLSAFSGWIEAYGGSICRKSSLKMRRSGEVNCRSRLLQVPHNIEAKKFRQQLKRNLAKFPEDYAFQVSAQELDFMVSQNVTPSKQLHGGTSPEAITKYKEDKK